MGGLGHSKKNVEKNSLRDFYVNIYILTNVDKKSRKNPKKIYLCFL